MINFTTERNAKVKMGWNILFSRTGFTFINVAVDKWYLDVDTFKMHMHVKGTYTRFLLTPRVIKLHKRLVLKTSQTFTYVQE